MSNETTFLTKVYTFERLHNSLNGNPRYRVEYALGARTETMLTKPDAGFASGLSLCQGMYNITVNGRNQITNMEPA